MKPRHFFFLFLIPAASAAALEFRVLSWDGAVQDLRFQNGRETVVIFAQDNALSQPYHKTDQAPLEFFREAVVDGKPIRTPMTTPTPPAGMERGILILARGPGTDSYLGSWIEDSEKTTPVGTMRFYNYTKQPLALKTPAEQWLQAPGETHRVAFDIARRSVAIQVATQMGEQWRRVANITQPVRPGHRVLVLIRNGRPIAGLPAEPVELLVFYDQ